MSPGNPPDVDIYIDDGRHGEYQYQENFWSCKDLWTRHLPDGETIHQYLIPNRTNYLYVRVRNRGISQANNVSVGAYHGLPGVGLTFPDDWLQMTASSSQSGTSIAAGSTAVLGPFVFNPQSPHDCLLAVAHADGDAANVTTIRGAIGENRLVPFDNNIGRRSIFPVKISTANLLGRYTAYSMWVRNPLRETAQARLETRLPSFLQTLGWELAVVSEGGASFEIGPRAFRKVEFSMRMGGELRADIVNRAIANEDTRIELRAFLNDELLGGVTHLLSVNASVKMVRRL